MKELTKKDIQRGTHRSRDYIEGALDVANLVNEMYSGIAHHKYLLGDCVLSKLNLLKPSKNVRVNRRSR